MKPDEALSYCSQRVVSDQDVQLMTSTPSHAPKDHVPRRQIFDAWSEEIDPASPDVVPFRRRRQSERDGDTIHIPTRTDWSNNGMKRSAEAAGLLEEFKTPHAGPSRLFKQFARTDDSRAASLGGEIPAPGQHMRYAYVENSTE